jgi:hypothetical protein
LNELPEKYDQARLIYLFYSDITRNEKEVSPFRGAQKSYTNFRAFVLSTRTRATFNPSTIAQIMTPVALPTA